VPLSYLYLLHALGANGISIYRSKIMRQRWWRSVPVLVAVLKFLYKPFLGSWQRSCLLFIIERGSRALEAKKRAIPRRYRYG
jgi:hypothetical protein